MGGIGGSFSRTVKPIVPLPMVVSYGRLGGDLFFFLFFFGKSAVFWGAAPPVARDLGGFEKAFGGSPLLGPNGGPQSQKPRSWHMY